MDKSFEILRQISALGTAVEPSGEVGGIGGGEALVTDFPGEFDDGSGAESAVEMLVEQHLWEAADGDGPGECLAGKGVGLG